MRSCCELWSLCLALSKVHEIQSEVDLEDEEDAEKYRLQERDRVKFNMKLQQEGFTVQKSQIGKIVYTKLHCPFKRLCREAERVKFEMPIKDVSILA